MKRKERVIIYPLLGALLLGVFNLYNQGVPYDNNAAGFVLAGFSVLVTVLIGWQIYNAVSIDRRIRRLEARTSIALRRVDRANERINSTTSNSEQFGLGSCDLIFAMIREQSISAETNLTIQDIMTRRCDAYVMSARSIAAVLSTQRTEQIYTHL